MSTVSIITISQFIRIDFLRILSKCIEKQDYPNIIEWVIIDTSMSGYNKTDDNLINTIQEFKENKNLPKIIYHSSSKTTIGAWRNESNKLVSGDIIVCMDDDDYYPSTRVSHAVEKLNQETSYLIAGCDKLYFYDIHFKKVYSFKGFGQSHSTNNCMAYRKEYLLNHSYDENLHNAEEGSFTGSYTEKMIQLDSDKTVLQFSHDTNTYNKKKIIITNYIYPNEKKYVIEETNNIDYFIKNKEILNDYLDLFIILTKPKKSPYDIVYFMGLSIEWSPKQNNLGGSEQAVKHLTTEWSKNNKRVAVYGNFVNEEIYNNVYFIPYYKFNFWDEFDVLILWRIYGCIPHLNYNLNARKILLDLHDNDNFNYSVLLNNKSKINTFMFKSKFHLELSELMLRNTISNNAIIPNGIRVDSFTQYTEENRNPFRLCYCSCYTRGLYRILSNIWPFIYKLEPRAELHVYYGMDLVKDEVFMKEMQMLLSQPGVMDHGRQPVEIISREKHMSTFHLYYTDSLAEIDCISIRESLVAGCVPIISNVNLFNERQGLHLQWFPDIENFNYQIACTIVEFMHNKNLVNKFRDEIKNSPTIITWQDCALEWLKQMN